MFSCIYSNYGSSFSRCCNRLGAGRYRFSLCAGIGNNLFSLSPGLVNQLFGGSSIRYRSSSIRYRRNLSLCPDHNGLIGFSCFFQRYNRCGDIIKGWPRQQTCTLADLRYRIFPLNSHDMNTGHALDLFNLVDDINTDIDTFLRFILCSPHPVYDLIGHVHARYKFFHIVGHANGFGRGNTGKNICFFRQTQIPGHFHEFCKFLDVVDNLGLDEISAVGNLLAHAHGTELKGIGKRIGCSTKEQLGRLTLDLFSALEFLGIPHVPNHTEHLDGIHVKDTLGARMITKLLMVTGQTEQVL